MFHKSRWSRFRVRLNVQTQVETLSNILIGEEKWHFRSTDEFSLCTACDRRVNSAWISLLPHEP